ncbi:CHASE2 domain-containing protein [Calothrix sp. CCY 0018]|uniref:CHASE2 domain-containing protein n=1 Tax=Calothrix sp. CCY 0018 TaxID=3103864 RepID=UPI0039C75626
MSNFNLKIQLIENTCLFELAWGESQQLNATLTYPQSIANLYHEWQQCYLKFYKNSFRGRVADIGTIAPPPIDSRAKLVEAETKFLYEFRHWLRSAELYQIRSTITNYHSPEVGGIPITQTNVFLTCNSIELERLPWEAWNIGNEFAITSDIRIVRKPINISQPNTIPIRHRKARILAILGDDTGLGFAEEKKALNSLKKVVDVKFIGWEPRKDINQLKQDIVNELSDNIGWDILFFAGHSNETNLTGGEIVIAPNTALYLNEIQTPLTIAKENGLQVAIFNSCSGLSIANKLIDLGFSQVAIMREPIHNQVAVEFFMQFSQALAEYKDVHQSLLAASEYLNQNNYIYPSSYLIPSLFRHPAADLFRIEPSGFKHQIKQWFPKRREIVTIGTLAILSCLPSIQDALLDWRIGVQSAYRQVTHQIHKEKSPPPILLIHVDEKSLNDVDTSAYKFNPIDKSYLAKIIDKLTDVNANVVGIDYLLDRRTDEDKILAESIQNSRQKNNTLFVFGSILNNQNQEQGLRDSIASSNQVLQGYVDKIPGHLSLLSADSDCTKSCPFTYLLALSHSFLKQQSSSYFKILENQDLRAKLIKSAASNPDNSSQTRYLNQLRLNKLTTNSEIFGQTWLYPIIDFSIPPNRVYQVISASDFLKKENASFDREQLKQQIILIGAGGYGDAGLARNEPDIFPIPKGVAYWRLQSTTKNYIPTITGVEINAYMIHHLLKQRLVNPIPDLWAIAITALIGKALQIILAQRQFSRRDRLVLYGSLAGGNVAYALTAMQFYIWGSILLPLFLPSAVFWFYILTRKENK